MYNATLQQKDAGSGLTHIGNPSVQIRQTVLRSYYFSSGIYYAGKMTSFTEN